MPYDTTHHTVPDESRQVINVYLTYIQHICDAINDSKEEHREGLGKNFIDTRLNVPAMNDGNMLLLCEYFNLNYEAEYSPPNWRQPGLENQAPKARIKIRTAGNLKISRHQYHGGDDDDKTHILQPPQYRYNDPQGYWGSFWGLGTLSNSCARRETFETAIKRLKIGNKTIEVALQEQDTKIADLKNNRATKSQHLRSRLMDFFLIKLPLTLLAAIGATAAIGAIFVIPALSTGGVAAILLTALGVTFGSIAGLTASVGSIIKLNSNNGPRWANYFKNKNSELYKAKEERKVIMQAAQQKILKLSAIVDQEIPTLFEAIKNKSINDKDQTYLKKTVKRQAADQKFSWGCRKAGLDKAAVKAYGEGHEKHPKPPMRGSLASFFKLPAPHSTCQTTNTQTSEPERNSNHI